MTKYGIFQLKKHDYGWYEKPSLRWDMLTNEQKDMILRACPWNTKFWLALIGKIKIGNYIPDGTKIIVNN